MLQIQSKKLLLGICFFGLFIFNSFGQSLGDYQSLATGTWNVAGTWQTFNGVSWVAAGSAPTAASGIITILNTHIVTISSAVSNSASIIVNNGGTLRVNTGFTLTNNAAGLITNNGTLSTLTTTGTITNNGTINNNLTFTNAGTLTNNLTLNNATGGTITNTRTVTNTGTINNFASIINNPTASTYIFTNSSTGKINIESGGTLTNSSATAANRFLDNSGLINVKTGGTFTNTGSSTASVQNLSGGMIINSGTINPGASSNVFHFDSGSKYQHYFTASTGTIPAVLWNSGSTCEIRECGPTAAGPSFTAATAFSDFIWADTNQTIDINLGGKLSVSGNFTVRHTGGDNLILKNTSGSNTYALTGNLTVETNGNLILTNGGAGFSTSGLTINISGNYSQTGGTCSLTTSATTTGTSPAGNGVLNITGTFTLSGGTLNMCSSAATSTQANGTITVGSTCTISGGTLNLNSSTTTGGGGLSVLNVSGNFAHTGGTISKPAVAAANTATINIIGTAAQSIESTSGFTSGHTIAFNINQTTSAGFCHVASAKIFKINTGTTVKVARNAANTAQPDLRVPNTSTIDLGPTILIDNSTLTGAKFSVLAGGTLMTQHAGGIATTGATGCIQTTGTRVFTAASSYAFYGTTPQITGAGMPTSVVNLTINNSTALATGGVTLINATAVTSTLNLTLGSLITSTNLITLNNGSSVSPAGGSLVSFVDGPIRKIGYTVGTEFVFPTGDVTKWARIGFKYASGGTASTNTFTAEYVMGNPALAYDSTLNHTVLNRELNKISYVEFWDLTRNIGAGVGKVKLYWEDATFSGITSTTVAALQADLRLAHYYDPGSGLKWYGESTSVTPIVATVLGSTGTIESTLNFTAFSPITFGSRNLVNPLPVELLYFTGQKEANGNQLEWSTASETNNDFFDLERSMDGNTFNKLTSVDGHGTTSAVHNYEYLDVNPFVGINYYRLKQVDFDGNYAYSNIISIENELTENATVSVFPNPSSDVVNIITSTNYQSIVVYNMLGEIVFSSYSNEARLQFKPVSNGIYVVRAILNDGKELNTRFIKK